MKKLVCIMCFLLIGVSMTAQTKYEKGMKKAFSLLKEQKIAEAVNMFERISKAEPKEWLPSYYAANFIILQGFSEKDKTKLKEKTDKAQALIDQANSISPNNPEIMILQAMLHTVWVAYDGATYGMTLAPKVSQIYAKALAMDAKNPRVVLCKAEWDMGSARYFGKDIKPYCKEIERAATLFSTFKPASEFHPNWGKERAAELLKTSCKED